MDDVDGLVSGAVDVVRSNTFTNRRRFGTLLTTRVKNNLQVRTYTVRQDFNINCVRFK
jgi:hypothetical protein